MAGSVNKVILVGNLGQDPTVRQTQAGDDIVTLSIATSESWRDKNSGERKERTEWHRVVIFNQAIAKTAKQYLKKGAKVFLEGQLQTRKWTDAGGAERYATEIVLAAFRGELTMLESRRDDPPPASGEEDYGSWQPPQHRGTDARGRSTSGGGGGGPHGLDDEIPFAPEVR